MKQINNKKNKKHYAYITFAARKGETIKKNYTYECLESGKAFRRTFCFLWCWGVVFLPFQGCWWDASVVLPISPTLWKSGWKIRLLCSQGIPLN